MTGLLLPGWDCDSCGASVEGGLARCHACEHPRAGARCACGCTAGDHEGRTGPCTTVWREYAGGFDGVPYRCVEWDIEDTVEEIRRSVWDAGDFWSNTDA